MLPSPANLQFNTYIVAPRARTSTQIFNACSLGTSKEGKGLCRVSVLPRSTLASAIMIRSHSSSQGVDDQGVALGQHRTVLDGLNDDGHIIRQVQIWLPREVEEQVEVGDALGVGLAGGLLQVRPQLCRACASTASERQNVVPLCSICQANEVQAAMSLCA